MGPSRDSDSCRGIVFNTLSEDAKIGVSHIEVLVRGTIEPKWKVDRIRPHLAITEQALDRSMIQPLSSGAVSPKSCNDAFRWWRGKRVRDRAFVCETSVLECIEAP